MKYILISIIAVVCVGFLGYAGTATTHFEKKAISVTEQSALQDGDIIFQSSISDQCQAIQLATHSPYSHVGMIYKVNGKLFVYEAIQPVSITPLKAFVNRGQKKHFVVKRLKNANAILTKKNVAKMKHVGERFKGKNYDLYFGWSDERIYCSELVWKMYKEALDIEVGKLEKLSDFDLSSDIVKYKLAERYGSNIPLDELVVSPASIFNSDKLETVMEH